MNGNEVDVAGCHIKKNTYFKLWFFSILVYSHMATIKKVKIN
jgi:hypothetical protein